MDGQARQRRSDLDWMRLSLVLAALLSACARALGVRVTGTAVSAAVDLVGAEASTWLVPLFLLVSAGSASQALGRQGTRGFLVGRVLRLFVPAVVASLVIALGTAVGLVDPVTAVSSRGWFPWYLLVLFCLSLLLVPVHAALSRPAGRRLVSGFASVISVPGILQLAGILPVAAATAPVLLGTPTPLALWGWSMGFHGLVFLFGFLLYREPDLPARAARQRWLSAGFFVVLAAAAVAARHAMGLPLAALSALRAMAAWSLVLSCAGIAAHWLERARGVPRVVSEAALPVSVLAFPCARLIAAATASLQWPFWLRACALTVATILATAALCAVIQRVTLLRFCFGLAPRAAAGQGGTS